MQGKRKADQAPAHEPKRTRTMADNGQQPGVDIDENLHSRQLAVYGREAMRRMAGSAVLVSGANGTGVEIGEQQWGGVLGWAAARQLAAVGQCHVVNGRLIMRSGCSSRREAAPQRWLGRLGRVDGDPAAVGVRRRRPSPASMPHAPCPQPRMSSWRGCAP
jgi:hypothetical protein